MIEKINLSTYEKIVGNNDIDLLASAIKVLTDKLNSVIDHLNANPQSLPNVAVQYHSNNCPIWMAQNGQWSSSMSPYCNCKNSSN